MGIHLTEDQKLAVLKGEAIRLAAPEIGSDVVLLRADAYTALQDALREEREQAEFRAFARKQAARLAQENPY